MGLEHGSAMRNSTLKQGPQRWGAWILVALALLLAGAASGADQSPWHMLGPFGGNARALAYDPSYPDHILLGSGAGAIFESLDSGLHWTPFAQLGSGHDLMLQTIAFDPTDSATIYAAGWSITGSGGGFYLTRDGGRSWSQPAALLGKSIQALALAGSDPRTLVAAALDGLYRSQDRGDHWERISPAGDADLKNFEAVAIDPDDAQIIYAGTWHLPWKTSDGGLHWRIIKQGVIDDSDVFSIILDQGNPQTVFASACSGIYKSEDGGELFRKVEGIPGSARRTRVLRQDPEDGNTVYAGTTEGLWKSSDGGRDFKLISPLDFIVNGVLVDPRDSRRLLIATDRGGVFVSDDSGQTFHASNEGFSQRQITALVADPEAPSDLYVSVLNDKEFGGVFHLHDGSWTQLNEGLGSDEVFDLRRSPAGQLVAATNHGLYLFTEASQRWEPSRTLLIETMVPLKTVPLKTEARPRSKASLRTKARLKTKSRHKNRALARSTGAASSRHGMVPRPGAIVITRSTFAARATALALGSRRWYAATAAGILISVDQGGSWSGGAVDGEKNFYSVAARDRTVAAASLREVWYSSDEGEHWWRQPLPPWVTRIYSVAVAGEDEVWIATREGALRWRRTAAGTGQWEHVLNGLPAREVISIRAEDGWLVAGAAASNTVYVNRDMNQDASREQGLSWEAEPPAGFEVTGAVLQGENLYVISRQHGVLEREPAASAAELRSGGN
jgi:photosystem II stability/assembly factor-like uncharacterized protein